MASSVFHYCCSTRWTVTAAIPECILIYNWFSNILPVEMSCINQNHVSTSSTKAAIHTSRAGIVQISADAHFPQLIALAKDSSAGERCSRCLCVSRVITDGSWLFLHSQCFTNCILFYLIVLFQQVIHRFSLPLPLPPPQTLDSKSGGWWSESVCLSSWLVLPTYLWMFRVCINLLSCV